MQDNRDSHQAPSTQGQVRPRLEAVVAGLLIWLVASGGVGFVWKRAYDTQFESIRQELLHLAATAAVQVDGDLHRRLTSESQTGSAEHLQALAPLVAFHKANPDLIYVYTAVLQGDRTVFVLGTDYLYDAPYDDLSHLPADPLMVEYLGKDRDFRKALEQQAALVNERPLTGQYRSYLSAFAPIRDASGEFAGIVGIDMWTRQLDARLDGIRNTALLGIGGVSLLSCLCGLLIFRERLRFAAIEQRRLVAVEEAIAARDKAEAFARETELTKQSLLESEERSRLAQTSAKVGVWDWDAETLRLHWSPELVRLHGLKAGHAPVSIDAWAALLHPDDVAGTMAEFQRALELKEHFQCRFRIVRPDGSLRWLQSLGGGVGGGSRVLGVNIDVTENVELELELERHRDGLERLVEERTGELRASEARFRGLVEQSLVGVFILDERVMSYANPGMARMLGYDNPDELLAHREELGFVSLSAEPWVLAAEEHAGQGAHIATFEARQRSGEPVRLEIHSQPLAGDAAGGRIAIAIDVTDRERAAQARESALAAIEQLSRLKGEFMNNVSHELRTPLNGIIGNAHLGMRAQELERTGVLFERILGSGKNLQAIVEQMLDFSSLAKGALDVGPVPTDVGPMLDGLSEVVRPQAARKGLAFADVRDPGLPLCVMLDPLRVGQVLNILLTNALKFTETGTVELHSAADGDSLRFSVVDTGIGMSQAAVERLFVPFEQADGSITRRFGGTGLGLALAHLLVVRMGGTIRVESAQNRGSRFELILPLAGLPAAGTATSPVPA